MSRTRKKGGLIGSLRRAISSSRKTRKNNTSFKGVRKITTG